MPEKPAESWDGFLKETVLIPLFGRISAVLISFFALILSLMLLTQNSLLDILNSAKKQLGALNKSSVPAVINRLRVKKRRKNSKGENTKKEAARLCTATHRSERPQGGPG